MTQSSGPLSRQAQQLLDQMVVALHECQLPLNHPWIVLFHRRTNTTILRLKAESGESTAFSQADCFVAVMELLQSRYVSVESLQYEWWEISVVLHLS